MCRNRRQLSQEEMEPLQETTGKNVAFVKTGTCCHEKWEKSEANVEFMRIKISLLKSKYKWKDTGNWGNVSDLKLKVEKI